MNTKTLAQEPKILLVMLSVGWAGITRLPRALRKAGFRVASYCHESNILTKTRFSEQLFTPPEEGNIFRALVDVIRKWEPDLLIPGCEHSVKLFHEIINADSAGLLPSGVDDVISLFRRSLGDSQHYQATVSKHRNQEIAARLGLRTPKQTYISGVEDALQVAIEYGFPLVLKGDFGFAGDAVKICNSQEEIPDAFSFLMSRSSKETIVIQQYIDGALAMRAGVSVSGELLESLVAEKLRTYPQPTSPSSVARFFEHKETEDTLSALIREYGFTGFCAADFCIERETGHAYLLEFNPRPIPLSSLGYLYGHDLCRALHCHFSGISYERSPPASNHKTVAFFPNELLRDPQSIYLTQAHHDVPWDDYSLLTALIQMIAPSK